MSPRDKFLHLGRVIRKIIVKARLLREIGDLLQAKAKRGLVTERKRKRSVEKTNVYPSGLDI